MVFYALHGRRESPPGATTGSGSEYTASVERPVLGIFFHMFLAGVSSSVTRIGVAFRRRGRLLFLPPLLLLYSALFEMTVQKLVTNILDDLKACGPFQTRYCAASQGAASRHFPCLGRPRAAFFCPKIDPRSSLKNLRPGRQRLSGRSFTAEFD